MVLNFNGARLGDRNLDDGELPEALNSSFYCDDEVFLGELFFTFWSW